MANICYDDQNQFSTCRAMGAPASPDLAEVSLPDLSDPELQPDQLTAMGGFLSNTFLGELVNTALLAAVTPAPIQTPTSTAFPVRGLGSPMVKAAGGSPHATREVDPEARSAADLESQRYEDMLALNREEVARQAALDRLTGVPSRAVAQDDRMRALEAQQAQFAAIDMGDGVTAPAPYMVNFTNAEVQRRRGSASYNAMNTEVTGDPSLGAAWSNATVGRGTPEELSQLLRAVGDQTDFDTLAGSASKPTEFSVNRAELLGPDSDAGETRAANVLTAAERGGVGVDCAGYVEQMLIATGQVPASLFNEVKTTTNVTGLTGSMGKHLPGNQGHAVPVDGTKSSQVEAGDMLQMEDDEHIGVVLQTMEDGDEVIVRVGHSTTTQEVYNGNTQVGTRPEGVREDIVVWNKRTESWRAVRSAYSSDRINGGLYEGFARTDEKKATHAARFWMGTEEDPWSMPATRAKP